MGTSEYARPELLTEPDWIWETSRREASPRRRLRCDGRAPARSRVSAVRLRSHRTPIFRPWIRRLSGRTLAPTTHGSEEP
jgi:hypothetical protein